MGRLVRPQRIGLDPQALGRAKIPGLDALLIFFAQDKRGEWSTSFFPEGGNPFEIARFRTVEQYISMLSRHVEAYRNLCAFHMITPAGNTELREEAMKLLTPVNKVIFEAAENTAIDQVNPFHLFKAFNGIIPANVYGAVQGEYNFDFNLVASELAALARALKESAKGNIPAEHMASLKKSPETLSSTARIFRVIEKFYSQVEETDASKISGLLKPFEGVIDTITDQFVTAVDNSKPQKAHFEKGGK